jgi:HD superfamily phosphohydrolase
MAEEEKVLKDPVHGYIYIHDALYWDLVNTRELQRLRRIRQLGTAYLTYPGGEHSRFSHALGTYEVVRRILHAFQRNAYGFPADLERLVLAAALLHDIGHGPLSHALEPFWGPSHEAWGEAILRSPETEVHQVLAGVDPAFPGEVADVIMKRHPHRLAVSMVSGQLDADRLDYLMRDSLFTGVDYGKFDLNRILRIILPVGDRLVVKRTGLHTVEAYLLARYFMYWQVYFHPVCRSAEVVLKKAIKRAQDLARQGQPPPSGHPVLDHWLRGGALSLEQYLALDDYAVMNALQAFSLHPDPILADLARRFRDRRLFRYVEFRDRGDPRLFADLERVVEEEGLSPRYYLDVDETAEVYYDYYVGEEGGHDHDQALYLWDGRELTEMSRLSKPISGIAREPQSERRLFFPERVEPRVLARMGRA